jgi:hypothetical protein
MVYIHGSDLHGLQAMTIYMYRRRIKHVVLCPHPGARLEALWFEPWKRWQIPSHSLTILWIYLLCDFRQLQISVPLFHNSSIAGWTQYMFIFMEMNVFCMRRERDGKCSENHTFLLRLVQHVVSYEGTYI